MLYYYRVFPIIYIYIYLIIIQSCMDNMYVKYVYGKILIPFFQLKTLSFFVSVKK